MDQYDPNFQPVKHYFLVGQKAVIYNHLGEILVLRRSSRSSGTGMWSLPGGGLEAGESTLHGIVREIKEETRLTAKNITPFYIKSYIHQDDNIIIIAYRASFSSGEVVLNWEHDTYQWVNFLEAKKLRLTPDADDIITKYFKTE